MSIFRSVSAIGEQAWDALGETIPVILQLLRISDMKLLSSIQNNARFSGTRVVIATADVHLGKEFNGKVVLVLIKPISFTQLRELTGRLRMNDLPA